MNTDVLMCQNDERRADRAGCVRTLPGTPASDGVQLLYSTRGCFSLVSHGLARYVGDFDLDPQGLRLQFGGSGCSCSIITVRCF